LDFNFFPASRERRGDEVREDEEGNEKRNPVQTLSLSLSLSRANFVFVDPPPSSADPCPYSCEEKERK